MRALVRSASRRRSLASGVRRERPGRRAGVRSAACAAVSLTPRRVAGFDVVRQPAHVRRVIGLAGQSAAVEDAMTGRENLEMVGRLFGLDRAAARAATTAVLDQLQLGADADRLVRTYSGGMRRRLDLGASLVG